MLTEEDTQVIGVQFDGDMETDVWVQSFFRIHPYTEVASLEAVIASAGEVYWQDHANDRVWVKLRGGRWRYWTDDPNEDLPSFDDLLYEGVQLRILGTGPVSVDESDALPAEFRIAGNFPNPFNPSTTLEIDVASSSDVRVEIFDMTGRLVQTLADGAMSAGRHSLTWDATSRASGVYLVRMSHQDGVSTRKILLLR
jgi:hypothetical protein